MQKELTQKREEFNEASGSHQTLPLALSTTERERLRDDVARVDSLFRKVQTALSDKIASICDAVGSRKDLWSSSQEMLSWLGQIKESLQCSRSHPLHPDAVAKLIQEHKVSLFLSFIDKKSCFCLGHIP